MNASNIFSSNSGYYFLFYNDELLLKDTIEENKIPFLQKAQSLPIEATAPQAIGTFMNCESYVAKLHSRDIPEGYSLINLRQLYGQLPDESFWFSFRALHILNWLKTNNFCGCCGKPMSVSTQELALQCIHCGHILYPRISPAIIVAVSDNDKILLARNGRFRPGMYSVIAGFVEPGETLEQCVRRELQEEVGIEVSNIEYFGNQPWPFPDSLMIAFTAQYLRGSIAIDNNEVVAAGWYTADNLPGLPNKDSIARKLIDSFLANHK